jgi:signal transduction histidine kinase
MERLPEDLPFALIYTRSQHRIETEQTLEFVLTGCLNQDGAREHIKLTRDPRTSTWSTSAPDNWPIHHLIAQNREVQYIKPLPKEASPVIHCYGEEVFAAAMVAVGDLDAPRAIIICGLNTRSDFDEPYQHFLLDISKTLNTTMLLVAERQNEVRHHDFTGGSRDTSSLQEFERTAKEQSRRAEEAVTARKAQEYYLDIVAHEYRNPISAIVQASELLENSFMRLSEQVDRLDPSTRDESTIEELSSVVLDIKAELREGIDTASAISTAAKHQQTISSDILSASRLAEGLLNISQVDCLVIEEFESVIKLYTAQAEGADIELRLIYGKEITTDLVLRLDPTRLAQIVSFQGYRRF